MIPSHILYFEVRSQLPVYAHLKVLAESSIVHHRIHHRSIVAIYVHEIGIGMTFGGQAYYDSSHFVGARGRIPK
jgi:hypothetical protein